MSGGPVPLPVFFEFDAPSAWRAVEFISDLHLAPFTPRTVEAWQRYLLGTDADAVFILGDLFEVWVGDDALSRPFEKHCAEILAQAGSRRHTAFMAGNRDFLVGGGLLRSAGMTGLPDPTVLDAWGQRLLLTHGDALCLEDHEYQHFRSEVRGDVWRRDFLSIPLPDRLHLAGQMRAASEARKRGLPDPALWADIDVATAVAWMHAAGTPELVHGHTHRPGSAVLAPGYKRHVLSDWDLDGPKPRAQVLRLTRDGLERRQPVG